MDILKIKKPKSLSQKFEFFPGIKDKIFKSVESLGLEPFLPSDSIQKAWERAIQKPKHTLIFFCRYHGKPAVYKALILNQAASIWGFERNVTLSQELEKIIDFFPTKILDYQIEKKDFKYLIHAYFSGQDFEIADYTDRDIDLVIKGLDQWQKIDYSKIPSKIKKSKIIGPDARLYQQSSKLDLAWISFYLDQIGDFISEKEKIINYIKDNGPKVDAERQNLCHGDLTLVNILLDRKKERVHFIDYEYTRADHLAWDPANFYFITWERPEIQVKFLQKYLSQCTDPAKFWSLFQYQTIFDMTLLAYYSLVEIGNRFQKIMSLPKRKKAVKNCQKSFWHAEQRLHQALEEPKKLLEIPTLPLTKTKFNDQIIEKIF